MFLPSSSFEWVDGRRVLMVLGSLKRSVFRRHRWQLPVRCRAMLKSESRILRRSPLAPFELVQAFESIANEMIRSPSANQSTRAILWQPKRSMACLPRIRHRLRHPQVAQRHKVLSLHDDGLGLEAKKIGKNWSRYVSRCFHNENTNPTGTSSYRFGSLGTD